MINLSRSLLPALGKGSGQSQGNNLGLSHASVSEVWSLDVFPLLVSEKLVKTRPTNPYEVHASQGIHSSWPRKWASSRLLCRLSFTVSNIGLEISLICKMSKGRTVCQGPDGSNSSILRNTETLMMLVAQGILPPEVQPPDLTNNPTSTYNSWLNNLLPPLRSAVLSKVPKCSIQKHFLKVSGDGPEQGDAGESALPHSPSH